MFRLGLLGKNIEYSFSKAYFTEKFKMEHLPYTYENFDINSISQFPKIIKSKPNIAGLNVTIPYKEEVIGYLDDIETTAGEIGAVNTIKILNHGKLKGYNTDYYGFQKSIKPYLQSFHKKALILGTGGASKAVAYALNIMNIEFHYVSRKQKSGVSYTYDDLTLEILKKHHIIINCTPLGTFPEVSHHPNIPYEAINGSHLLYDLIYNPSETEFLRRGKLRGATICNGKDMLRFQAERAWEIWDLD